MIRRFIRIFVALVLLSFPAFCEDWYVCLGSFKKQELAEKRMGLFVDSDISAFISEAKSKDGDTLYRVLYFKPFDSYSSALSKRRELSRHPVIRKFGIDDLWCCKSDGPLLKTVEIVKEVPVEVEKEVVKEVPVEVIKEVPVEVEKEVIKEVIKEVPVEKKVEVVKEVPVEVVKEVIKEVPVEVIKEVPVEKEVIKEVIKEVPVEIIKEVIKEVPVEKDLSGKNADITNSEDADKNSLVSEDVAGSGADGEAADGTDSDGSGDSAADKNGAAGAGASGAELGEGGVEGSDGSLKDADGKDTDGTSSEGGDKNSLVSEDVSGSGADEKSGEGTGSDGSGDSAADKTGAAGAGASGAEPSDDGAESSDGSLKDADGKDTDGTSFEGGDKNSLVSEDVSGAGADEKSGDGTDSDGSGDGAADKSGAAGAGASGAEPSEDGAEGSDGSLKDSGSEATEKDEVPAKFIDYDKRTIIVRDSDTGEAVQGAKVTLNGSRVFVTDAEGKVVLPEDVVDGNYNVKISKDGEYVTTSADMTIKDSEIVSSSRLSIPKAVDYERVKIVLDWTSNSIDLDAHMKCGWRHVYYSNRKSKNMRLDHDERHGNGVETITIEGLDPSAVYEYYVYDFTNQEKTKTTALSNVKAHVSVFVNNTFKTEFTIKPNQYGTKWHVFNVVNGNDLDVKNTVSY